MRFKIHPVVLYFKNFLVLKINKLCSVEERYAVGPSLTVTETDWPGLRANVPWHGRPLTPVIFMGPV